MKITTTGSLGHVANLIVKKLIAAGHHVTVITSKADRQAEIVALGAKAAVGSVDDVDFLTQAFAGADSVFAMTPPAMGGEHIVENTANVGRVYAEAIENAGVKRVVMLSSIGAHAAEGTGPVKGSYQVEQILQQLSGVNLTILRPGFFYINFLRDIPLLKSRGIFGNNYNGDDRIPMSHPEDIATAAAEELQKTSDGIEVKYIVSDISTGNEIAKTLGSAIGKPDLTWTAFPDEQLKQGMLSAGVPPELAGLLTELGQGVRAGIVTEHFFATGAPVAGSIKLANFAAEFRDRYNA